MPDESLWRETSSNSSAVVCAKEPGRTDGTWRETRCHSPLLSLWIRVRRERASSMGLNTPASCPNPLDLGSVALTRTEMATRFRYSPRSRPARSPAEKGHWATRDAMNPGAEVIGVS